MNNVDRIFGEKLGGYTSAPPAGVWEKVEANLPTRKVANTWRWAAALLPLVVAAGWLLSPEPAQQQVADEKTIEKTPAPAVVTPEVKVATQPVAIRRKPKTNPVIVTPVLEPAPEMIAAAPETLPVDEITIEPVELIAEVSEPVPAKEKPIVIVITLEPIAATPEVDKKPLERVAEFAQAVKHSDPLGSLRGAKDELFALDLRKKSTKKN